ncbi:hypothetical protein VP01_1483g10 [Puccinia sorghi]|uniref:Uncharacterized protein n=1 Tax=Puccinia sorghi TaxID=27349 RepID=A0A0L6VLD1_9BASI|nr:hypothetical protein VP01_1483g10 [Puccinia sorghi]
MVFRPITLRSMLYSAVFIIGIGTVVLGDHEDHDHDQHDHDQHDHPQHDHDQDCHTYTDARSPTATCNEIYKCTGGCAGYVTATQCTRNPGNDVKASKTTEKCTLGYGKSSAAMTICINENGSFNCFGPTDGKAECKGCVMDASRHVSNTTTTSSSSPQPGDNSNAGSSNQPGSNTVPIVDTKAPEKPSNSSASSFSVNIIFLSIGALVSATFL